MSFPWLEETTINQDSERQWTAWNVSFEVNWQEMTADDRFLSSMSLCLHSWKPHRLTPLCSVCIARCTFKKNDEHLRLWAMHHREYKRVHYSGFTIENGYSVDIFLPTAFVKMPQSDFAFTTSRDLSHVTFPNLCAWFWSDGVVAGYCFQFVFHGRSMYTETKNANAYIIHSCSLATQVRRSPHALFREDVLNGTSQKICGAIHFLPISKWFPLVNGNEGNRVCLAKSGCF